MIAISRKGRKRKPGYRKPSGDLVRPERQEDARKVVTLQPHRRWAPEEARLDARCETPFGILSMRKVITAEQYQAGRMFARDVQRYLQAIDSPSPDARSPNLVQGVGRSYSATEPDPEVLARWRVNYRLSSNALGEAGTRAMRAVSRMAVHGEPMPFGSTVEMLICGLNMLARHYGLTNQRGSGLVGNT